MKPVHSRPLLFSALTCLSLVVWNAPIFAACDVPPHGASGNPASANEDGSGNGADDGDPVNVITGNEYRTVNDLEIWGGVGEHQLFWKRYSNSRNILKAKHHLGKGHHWRFSYQWEMSEQTPTSINLIYPDGSKAAFTLVNSTQ